MLSRNVQQFRGGLVFKAHKLLYRSTLGSRVIEKKMKLTPVEYLAPTRLTWAVIPAVTESRHSWHMLPTSGSHAVFTTLLRVSG